MSRRRRGNREYGGLVPGLIMMAVGAAFLLERFDIISARQIWRLWPLALIAIGLMRLLRPDGGRRSIFLLLLGIWLQISTLELFGLDFDDSWPLLIIFIGASFVFDALVGGAHTTRPGPRSVVEPGASFAPGETTEAGDAFAPEETTERGASFAPEETPGPGASLSPRDMTEPASRHGGGDEQ